MILDRCEARNVLPCGGCPDKMKAWTINVLYRHF